MREPEASERSWIRLVVGLAAVIAGVVVARWSGVFEMLSLANIDRLNTWFDGLGPWAPVTFVLLSFVTSRVVTKLEATEVQSQD